MWGIVKVSHNRPPRVGHSVSGDSVGYIFYKGEADGLLEEILTPTLQVQDIPLQGCGTGVIWAFCLKFALGLLQRILPHRHPFLTKFLFNSLMLHSNLEFTLPKGSEKMHALNFVTIYQIIQNLLQGRDHILYPSQFPRWPSPFLIVPLSPLQTNCTMAVMTLESFPRHMAQSLCWLFGSLS